MKRAHYLIISILLFSACRQHPDTELARTKALITTLDNSNKFISSQIKEVDQLLLDKCFDLRSAGKAKRWSSHTGTVKKLSADMCFYLDSLRTAMKIHTAYELFEKSGGKEQLSEKLNTYHNALLNTWRPDSLFAEFQNEEIKKAIRPMVTDISEDLVHRFDPGNATTETAYVMLDQIENDLLLTVHKMIRYAYLQIGMVDGSGFYDEISALIGANSTYLKAGQTLTINAGIGIFSRQSNHSITINGLPIKLDEEGIAEYSTIVGHHPGKHTIPVKIEYIRPDGAPMTFTKDVKYEIAP